MKRMLGNFGLLMIARVLYLIISPFALIYQHLKYIIISLRKRDKNIYFNAMSKYYYNKAFSLNEHGNASFYSLFNDLLIPPNGHRFGNPNERLSQVFGKNKIDKTIYPFGLFWAKMINKVAYKMGDTDHVQKAAERL